MIKVDVPSIVKLLAIRQVADLSGLCEKSIWNATAPRGSLACVKLGSRVMYRPEDVQAWIDSNVVRTPAEGTVSND